MSAPLQRIDCLNLILDTPKGRGVFAARKIEAGSVIDTAAVIVLTQDDFEKYIQHSTLLHYSYNWPKRCEYTGKPTMHQAIVLGLGSMFNHSAILQNIGWKRNLDAGVVVYSALRDIEEGEELLISYGPYLTFKDVEAQGARSDEKRFIRWVRVGICADCVPRPLPSELHVHLPENCAMVRQKGNDFASSSRRVTRSQGLGVGLTEDPLTSTGLKPQPVSAAPAQKEMSRKRKSDPESGGDNEERLGVVESILIPVMPEEKRRGKGKGKGKGKAIAEPAVKKQKKPAPEVEEKRLARWRAQPTQKLRDRIHRCLTQRMVVLDRKRDMEVSPPEETFQIAGSTGNVYEVHITHRPTCNCPDGIKNGLCKHVLYVMMKVLKACDELVYQSALLSSELEQIFTQAPAAPAGQLSSSKSSTRKPLEDDDCPICYSEFDNEESTVYCKAQCGTNIHEACFNQWAATKGAGKVTCVMCRQPWQGGDPRATLAKGEVGREGYVNVADQLGMSHYRDTSTYNQGYGGGYRKRGYGYW